MDVRLLAIVDIDRCLHHVVDVDAGSGLDGAGHSHPYGAAETVDLIEAHHRELARWSTGIDEPAWRRAWGLFDQGHLVGHLYLAGGTLRSELHRVGMGMGMGVVPSHRRQGGDSVLLQTAISWARRQPGIARIDLGVFSDNPGAQALYERLGFQVLGRTPDRFRVDGRSLDDTWMALSVSHTETRRWRR